MFRTAPVDPCFGPRTVEIIEPFEGISMDLRILKYLELREKVVDVTGNYTNQDAEEQKSNRKQLAGVLGFSAGSVSWHNFWDSIQLWKVIARTELLSLHQHRPSQIGRFVSTVHCRCVWFRGPHLTPT